MHAVRRLGLVGLALVLGGAPAAAHVAFSTPGVVPGGAQEKTLMLGHGCGADDPTVKLRVRMPPGVVDVTPKAASGWKAETVTGAYDKPVIYKGVELTEGVTEIVWSGRLDPHTKGAFSFAFGLADSGAPGDRLVFPVVQQCTKGVIRWIDPSEDGGTPAASLVVGPRR
ncbi:YcnI family protein [Hansschlegelia sp.]|uniref:YcnI family copper-binding membrane protein n=1 Tax=Hansschlegelia sp. TaxID=2041892 RepID=UPI002D19D1D1|nr:YcnI family protein [Hansschlegelia sp.]HVI27927.1 YcnI family protein [Hansschlegelia sp.]